MILIIQSLCDGALILLLLDFVVQISSMKRYCDVMKEGFWCFLASLVALMYVQVLIFPKAEMVEVPLQLVTFWCPCRTQRAHQITSL